MKFLIWFGCIVVFNILNYFIGTLIGYRLGYVLLYLLISTVATALCKGLDRSRSEKKPKNAAAEKIAAPVTPSEPVPIPVQNPPVQNVQTMEEPTQPEQPQAGVTLYLYSGPMAGTSFRTPVGRTVTLGRNPAKSDILLSQYDVVSGTHCQISCFADYITIVDLNSTNGTYVNGVRLTPHQPVSAKNGATIYLANSSCAFQVRFI